MKLINQQLIKDNNLKLIYNFIFSEQGISRAQLAKMTHLSKTTVSSLVDELIERKFIIDLGTADSTSVGRRPNCLNIRPNCYYTIVVIWEDGMITANLVDIVGTIVCAASMDIEDNADYVRISKLCIYERLLENFTKDICVLGLCIVIPAMIDSERHEIFSTLLNLNNNKYDILENLRKTFPEFAVALFNDTACYAYAEKVYTKISENNFAFINFSTGIGATLFTNGKMLGHASGYATQFGHCSVDFHGKQCSCGNRGCLELVIGENSLKDRMNKIKESSPLKNRRKITFSDLGKAAFYGDAVSRKVIKSIAEDFSFALNNLICLVHPTLIIIGGKGKDLGDLFLKEIKINLNCVGFKKMMSDLNIRYSLLDKDSFLNGAMKYFFDTHYSFTQDIRGSFFIG